jgi:hypothetical protein
MRSGCKVGFVVVAALGLIGWGASSPAPANVVVHQQTTVSTINYSSWSVSGAVSNSKTFNLTSPFSFSFSPANGADPGPFTDSKSDSLSTLTVDLTPWMSNSAGQNSIKIVNGSNSPTLTMTLAGEGPGGSGNGTATFTISNATWMNQSSTSGVINATLTLTSSATGSFYNYNLTSLAQGQIRLPVSGMTVTGGEADGVIDYLNSPSVSNGTQTAATPEPASVTLCGVGLACLAGAGWWRGRKRKLACV